MEKVRLDLLLVERGLVESRAIAQRLVMAGKVRVDGQVVLKPSTVLSIDAGIVLDEPARYVSRGGEKLEAALQAFSIEISGRVCADVGASTGGFTDCLLKHGAARVYAVDVGRGILSWSLRQDSRVVVMEGVNARYLEKLPEAVSLITIDVSFISLKTLLPIVKTWFGLGRESSSGDNVLQNEVIMLVKPQFEAGRIEVSRGSGVIRDPEVHTTVLLDVLSYAQSHGYGLRGIVSSPLIGPKGNVEFFSWLIFPQVDETDVRELVANLYLT